MQHRYTCNRALELTLFHDLVCNLAGTRNQLGYSAFELLSRLPANEATPMLMSQISTNETYQGNGTIPSDTHRYNFAYFLNYISNFFIVSNTNICLVAHNRILLQGMIYI